MIKLQALVVVAVHVSKGLPRLVHASVHSESFAVHNCFLIQWM